MKKIIKILSKIRLIPLILVLVLQLVFIPLPSAYAATTTVNLLTADSFAVLAGASVVDANLSFVTGNVGLSPASGTFIGITCAEVTGTIYDNDAGYTGAGGGSTLCRTTNPGLLTQAQTDLTAAFTDAANRTPATVLPGSDNQLGSLVLTDGVYSFSGSASTANLIGTLTLDGQGDPNSVFIFKSSSDFVTNSGSTVNLINGAQACNVFWQIPTSATFGTGSNFTGTVLADQSITDNGGSTINGRFLARIATVTLDDTTITKPTCAAPIIATSSLGSSSFPSTGTSVCTSTGVTTVPSIIEARRINSTSIFVSWGPYAGLSDFIIRYGYENGTWLFNTKVSGFSTTINDLPPNQSIWIEVAATDNCEIGPYGTAVHVGGTARTNSPGFPNTGIGPDYKNIPWIILAGLFLSITGFYLTNRVHKFSSKR